MSKNKLYAFYLISSCFGVFLLLSVLVSRLIAFFETPDVSISILQATSPIDFYKPSFKWQPLQNDGREMEKNSLTKITEDYLNSFHKHNLYLSSGNEAGLNDHFTKNSRPKIKYASFTNHEIQRVEYTTLSHDLNLKLYADDGTVVVLEDVQVNYHQLYENEKLVDGYYDTAKFEVMLLLEDNFWRVRHKIRSNVSYQRQKVSIDSVNEYVYIEGNELHYKNREFKSKGINYYPAEYPWDLFWPNFSEIPFNKDFELISSAGFNTIRVFIPYDQFGGSDIDEIHLSNMKALLDLAESYDLKVIVTLFDFFLGYSVDQWTLSERHAETIVSTLKDHPAILAWDVKNEPDLDFEQHGKESVKEWLKFMALSIKKYDQNHLVTIGWSTPEYITELDSSVDYYSFHFYRDPAELKNYLKTSFKKPVLLEETGQHSFNAWWYPFKKSTSDQKEYMSEILKVTKEHNLSYTLWTLYDFRKIPDNVVGTVHWRKGIQKNFGLIDKKNKPKPVFDLVKEYNLVN